MKRSLWNLSKYFSSFNVEYEEASLLIIFLNDACSECIGDLMDAEGEGDVTKDIGVAGVVWDL